ncbi:MAG: hypothetical protein Q9188_002992 [Gyalolechia gomerana]
MLSFPKLHRSLTTFLLLCLCTLFLLNFGSFVQPKARNFDAVFEHRHYKDILRQNLFTEHDEGSRITSGNRSNTPDFAPAVQHEGLRKRAFNFRYYVCKGGVQWAKAQEVSKGAPPSGPVFSDEDLQDGWSKYDKDKPDFIAWTTPLQDLVGRKPTRSDMQFTKLRQDKAFHNAAGELVQSGRSLSTTPEKLRYVAHDSVVNDVTVDVMNHIFGARYRGEKSVPWPGMKFGLESDKGKALLASPNEFGTFWLLLHRAAKLGRRKLEVTIFSEKDGAYHYCYREKERNVGKKDVGG